VGVQRKRCPARPLADDDSKACAAAHFDLMEEVPKTRVVCAVLDRDHFSLGVVRDPEVRAMFQLGPDWDEARHLILNFIKARKSPSLPLCSAWSPEYVAPKNPTRAPTSRRGIKKTENFEEKERGGTKVCSVSCLSSPVRNPPLLKYASHTIQSFKHPQSVSGGTGLGDYKKSQEEFFNTSRSSLPVVVSVPLVCTYPHNTI